MHDLPYEYAQVEQQNQKIEGERGKSKLLSTTIKFRTPSMT